MCSYISAFYRMCPELEVKVGCLYSHGATEKWLGIKPGSEWQEMHYLPTGDIECRTVECFDSVAEAAVRAKWPMFAEFESWALAEAEQYYPDGWDRDGYNLKGYNRNGYDRDGYDRDGYDCDGYDCDGYDCGGFNRDGFNCVGFDRNGSFDWR